MAFKMASKLKQDKAYRVFPLLNLTTFLYRERKFEHRKRNHECASLEKQGYEESVRKLGKKRSLRRNQILSLQSYE
jgi:hypothetical protein